MPDLFGNDDDQAESPAQRAARLREQRPSMSGPPQRDAPASTTQGRGSRAWFESVADKVPRPRAKRMISELFGKNARGGPNTSAAAKQLGVSQRTVQRWVKDGMPKRSPAGEQLSSTWRDSPKGRKASVSPKRRSELRQGKGQGPMVKVTAYVWVSSDRRNGQRRSFEHALSDAEADQIMDSSIAGDDDETHDIAEASFGFGEMNFVQIDWDTR